MIEISWTAEPVPRSPEIIVGFDTVALALYHRLQATLGESPANATQRTFLNSSATLLLGNNFLAVKAKSPLLPWVDGLSYLSASEPNSRLYLPTDLQPNVPIPWLEGALRKPLQPIEAPHGQRPDLLYWPTTNTLISADTYWPAATVNQNHLLTLWYEQHS